MKGTLKIMLGIATCRTERGILTEQVTLLEYKGVSRDSAEYLTNTFLELNDLDVETYWVTESATYFYQEFDGTFRTFDSFKSALEKIGSK